jgi:hypothetical protein
MVVAILARGFSNKLNHALFRPSHADNRERSVRTRSHPKKKVVSPHLLVPSRLSLGA